MFIRFSKRHLVLEERDYLVGSDHTADVERGLNGRERA